MENRRGLNGRQAPTLALSALDWRIHPPPKFTADGLAVKVRKRQQQQHPGLTLTGIYNVFEKLRSGDPLTVKEKQIHDQGLVTVLRQIHDDPGIPHWHRIRLPPIPNSNGTSPKIWLPSSSRKTSCCPHLQPFLAIPILLPSAVPWASARPSSPNSSAAAFAPFTNGSNTPAARAEPPRLF
jgi:hypothetical protein